MQRGSKPAPPRCRSGRKQSSNYGKSNHILRTDPFPEKSELGCSTKARKADRIPHADKEVCISTSSRVESLESVVASFIRISALSFTEKKYIPIETIRQLSLNPVHAQNRDEHKRQSRFWFVRRTCADHDRHSPPTGTEKSRPIRSGPSSTCPAFKLAEQRPTYSQRFGAGPAATNFSTSTQPKCKLASFAPASVRPTFPGLTL